MPFCGNCGKEVKDGAKFCGSCGAPTGVAVNVPDSRSGGADSAGTNYGADRSAGAVNQRRPQNVEDHIVKAIISTLLCIPLGVVAIVFAAQVKPALRMEDYEAAQIASKKANLWGNLALIIGIVMCAIPVIVMISLAIPQFSEASSTFTDSRDGKKYKIIKVGKQKWMAENLNYAAKGSVCYENNAANCDKYGRLYDWTTAKKACPAGFHLPTDVEWTRLVKYADREFFAVKKLKSKSGWIGNGNGTDEYGFAALPGGSGSSGGNFGDAGNYGSWWSATEDNADRAWRRDMYDYDNVLVHRFSTGKSGLFSVRCVKD